ncbi:uncharacterized protein SCHCODRAFT_02628791 [Schizophyllum commune H4-8]|uniref:uncharacterized protein n=1 Tax=Schizophyllum commune (strain H4-8 / FGSC 9210) TaxID=578458 RepID=UPI00215F9A2A|nr:uncharacterized protein SCHCODRAFT_02628791 [Schizophyllum commune H4-8]KAI5891333.1 hypothetical protein SCHCODRAFT_02628791 [Schizophyllum commune H4-8]
MKFEENNGASVNWPATARSSIVIFGLRIYLICALGFAILDRLKANLVLGLRRRT